MWGYQNCTRCEFKNNTFHKHHNITPTPIQVKNITITPEESLNGILPAITTTAPMQSSLLLGLLSHRLVLPDFDVYKKGIIQPELFCVWLLYVCYHFLQYFVHFHGTAVFHSLILLNLIYLFLLMSIWLFPALDFYE